ncbi:MAG: hypothetical protein DMG96_06750 [Acidobacteria bacterium]|nr:MAG: hypothetical protein DMG96_06750 [Acidobacteriota bacterium]
MNWHGVMPAITTCFDANLQVDHAFMAKHCRWLIDAGCTGIVPLGSLGEGATLLFEEKIKVLRTCVTAASGRATVVASISALSTPEAVALAKAAASTDSAHLRECRQWPGFGGGVDFRAFDFGGGCTGESGS